MRVLEEASLLVCLMAIQILAKCILCLQSQSTHCLYSNWLLLLEYGRKQQHNMCLDDIFGMPCNVRQEGQHSGVAARLLSLATQQHACAYHRSCQQRASCIGGTILDLIHALDRSQNLYLIFIDTDACHNPGSATYRVEHGRHWTCLESQVSGSRSSCQ